MFKDHPIELHQLKVGYSVARPLGKQHEVGPGRTSTSFSSALQNFHFSAENGSLSVWIQNGMKLVHTWLFLALC